MESLKTILKTAKSWNDIHKCISKFETTTEQGYAFEVFCKLFLQESNEYKKIWLKKEIPISIEKEFRLDGVDHGIDLLVETKQKKYLGVQCKWRSDESTILGWSKDKLSNVLAHQKLDGYIIFSNASDIDSHTKKQSGGRLISLLYDQLQHISAENIIAYKCILEKKQTPKKELFTPRPDQTEAIKDIINGLKKESRGKLILPCGSGKTLTALWLKEKLKPKRTLVLVPSLSLLRQVKEEWRIQKRKNYNYICVCSEKEIDNENRDDIPNNSISDIGFSGMGVFNDANEIKKILKSINEDLVVFSTYQSSDKLKGIKFDFAICDEAHKTATKKVSNFALIHKDKNIPCTKRLYMTATPRVTKDIKKGKKGEDRISSYFADMNDEKDFGKELYRMSFKEAIDKKILCDYKIIILETTRQKMKEIEESHIDNQALFTIFDKASKKYKIKKTITFHSTINSAQDFQKLLEKRKIYSQHVNGKQNTSLRARILYEFKKSKNEAVVTNARCLTEGIDVPTIDMVYFCNQRQSKIDIVQIIGRALRRARNKKFGYVLIPIIHSEDQKLNINKYQGDFGTVIGVLKAMQNHDNRLESEIQYRFLNKGTLSKTGNIIQSFNIENIYKEINLTQKDIDPYILDKSTTSQFKPFEDAKKFARELKLKNQKEWIEYSKSGKKPTDIPSDPYGVYKDDGWKGYGDWLGTGNIAPKDMEFKPFEDAKKFARELKLKNKKEWIEYSKSGKKPTDIPSAPNRVYKNDGWESMGDWLGTGNIAKKDMKYKPFKEAREFARELKLKGSTEWAEYSKSGKKPTDIPSDPRGVYKNDGWESMGDWLGTGFKPFKEAREFARELKLEGYNKEWAEYSKSGKRPDGIPCDPGGVYKNDGWKGYGDWLGTRNFKPFKEAREFARELKLKNKKEWIEYSKSGKKPNDIPSNPRGVYKNDGWESMGDWLGTGSIASKDMEFKPFKEAREFARELKLKGQKEWREYSKSGKKPTDIPSAPHRTYKDDGWESMGDWLGTGNIASKDSIRKLLD